MTIMSCHVLLLCILAVAADLMYPALTANDLIDKPFSMGEAKLLVKNLEGGSGGDHHDRGLSHGEREYNDGE